MRPPDNDGGRACDAAPAMDEGETAKTRGGGSSGRSIGAPDSAGRQSRLFAWRKAVAESQLKSTPKLVAFALSLHMDGAGGSCFPSQARLAAETSLSEKSVGTSVKVLEAEGWIRRTRGRRVVGENDRYFAAFPAAPTELHPKQVQVNEVRVNDVSPAPDDGFTGTSFPDHPNEVRTRTSGGRPKDVLRSNDAARDARSVSPWHVRCDGETLYTSADEADAREWAADNFLDDLEVVRESAA